jgi:ribosomal-protein-serine acetyltransferase
MMTTSISHLPDEVSVDEHIVLRAKSSESFDIFAEVVINEREHLSRWLPWATNAPDESSVEHYRDAPMKKKNNEAADYNIFYDEQLAGAIGLMVRDIEKLKLEIGYWLAQSFTGKGIMTACVRAITNLAFQETSTPAVEIGCDARNRKSADVAKRAGYKFDHEFREKPECPQVELGYMFTMSREQWLTNNQR